MRRAFVTTSTTVFYRSLGSKLRTTNLLLLSDIKRMLYSDVKGVEYYLLS